MPDFDPETSFDRDPELAEIRVEFGLGLTARLEGMVSALSLLAKGFEPEAAERLFRTAHALKGTAPSFGAGELVEDAVLLTELGRGWVEAGEAGRSELEEAEAALERLGAAAARYRRKIGAGGRERTGGE